MLSLVEDASFRVHAYMASSATMRFLLDLVTVILNTVLSMNANLIVKHDNEAQALTQQGDAEIHLKLKH